MFLLFRLKMVLLNIGHNNIASLSGMKGSFMVDSVGKSVPGKSPLEGVVN
jgi:hypothetical protein